MGVNGLKCYYSVKSVKSVHCVLKNQWPQSLQTSHMIRDAGQSLWCPHVLSGVHVDPDISDYILVWP